jgi:signal transduction histidine kinase
MDAQSESGTSDPSETLGPRCSFDNADLRVILSSLSQELCRPLVSLRAGFDLLLADASPSESSSRRGHVETMASLCDDLLRLTRGYLDYAGLVQGTLPLSFGSYTIGALIREIDRQFGPMATNKRIGWECAVDVPQATVTTDPSRFQRILGHIVANALAVTPAEGFVRVMGRLEERHWSVEVADDGPGIPAEELNRVFEPFYRINRDDRPRGDGSGLGLASCREMVVQLGGEIQIQSSPGQGTHVIVRLPRGTSEPVASQSLK